MINTMYNNTQCGSTKYDIIMTSIIINCVTSVTVLGFQSTRTSQVPNTWDIYNLNILLTDILLNKWSNKYTKVEKYEFFYVIIFISDYSYNMCNVYNIINIF